MAEEPKTTRKKKTTTNKNEQLEKEKPVKATKAKAEKTTKTKAKADAGSEAAEQQGMQVAEKKAKPARSTRAKEARKPMQQDTWSLLSEYDIYLFKEGNHFRLYDKLGAHMTEWEGKKGVVFALWAPNAQYVSVIGNFNEWNRDSHKMYPRLDGSGIWEIFIPDLGHGDMYKYFIHSNNGFMVEKADPFAFCTETPPATASVIWDLEYKWSDNKYMSAREKQADKPQPYAVYEVHLGSWRRVPEEDNRSLTYKEHAKELVQYVKEMNFTHVELMPVMEHPFGGSWGYQVTSYFAPTRRYGDPQEFMYLVNELHNAGIGVILDWVPSHFPGDEHGLVYFDGTHLYEHADPRQGFHPDWNSYIFNYGRGEVKSFLISSAMFWLDRYHVDGLRVDAVASMLYLDYSRRQGEWIPNEQGGNENIEAIRFMKELNEMVYSNFPGVQTIAEESTAWPMVSHPTSEGGLGFGMKWMMGWMHDTLRYFSLDPVYRQHHQGEITFSLLYAFHENFMLPLSHDEVVHGKGSLIQKMPGDEWQKFANLRTLYAYMYGHPGTKLLFMGAEFAQGMEWNHDTSLDWHLLQYGYHEGVRKMMASLNGLYKSEPALYEQQFLPHGFEWIDTNDYRNSIVSFIRRDTSGKHIVVVCNFTPVVRENYTIGVPEKGFYKEIFNTDDQEWGGSNVKNNNIIEVAETPSHDRNNSISITIPPLAVVYLKHSKTMPKE